MPESDDETWAPVPGYEGQYEVSDQGRVRSLDRTISHPDGAKQISGQILRTQVINNTVMVELARDGGYEPRSVARLVLLAHGPSPKAPTMVAKRIDDDRPACVDNLGWGRPITQAKLTEKEVLSIWRQAWAAEKDPTTTHDDIAARYGVSRQTVSHIKNGRTMAALAQDRMNEAGDSGYAVAQELGVNRSTVYRALGEPSTRHLQTLTRILGLYGITADPDSPAFPVESDDK